MEMKANITARFPRDIVTEKGIWYSRLGIEDLTQAEKRDTGVDRLNNSRKESLYLDGKGDRTVNKDSVKATDRC